MIRVLHLLDADGNASGKSDAEFQSQRLSHHLTTELGPGFEAEILTIGPGGRWPTLPAAIMGLRRIVEYDIIHTWGSRPLTAAVLGSRLRLVHSPQSSPTRRTARWLRALLSYRDFHIVCPTATLRRAFATTGVPLERCHLIRPGVEFSRIRRRRDRDLRSSLNLADDDYTILAVGDSTHNASHADAVWAASILHVLNPRFKLLLWGRGRDLPHVLDFARRFNNPNLIRIAQRQLSRPVDFEQLIPAADIVLNTSRGSIATLPLAICMAAALPIVSTTSYTVGEMLEDRHTALLVGRRSPRLLAQRLLQLKEDPDLQWKLSDMARTEAFDYFPLTRFLTQWRSAYRQLASNQPLEIPEITPGPGLRFHGRG
jgi:glycosyltransferase involved in cell wall biosynthesis